MGPCVSKQISCVEVTEVHTEYSIKGSGFYHSTHFVLKRQKSQ